MGAYLFVIAIFFLFAGGASAGELMLEELVGEALKNNPEIRAAEARFLASRHRVPQSSSLPDPMFMFGYQNEGTSNLFTYGEMPDSQWMFSLSQMVPFPGKLSLKEEMARGESGSLGAVLEAVKRRTAARVRELYYDLFLMHRSIDLVRERAGLFSKIEEASLARYSSGQGTQQEVVMAQTEKFMLLEREEMFLQRVQTIEAMLNTLAGRDVNAPLGKPPEPQMFPYTYDLDHLLKSAHGYAAEVRSREGMIASSEARVRMAKREFYPDFTLTGSYFAKTSNFPDMWSLTTSVNVPLFYRTKQQQAFLEAEASLSEARNEMEAAKRMVASSVRESYVMLRSAERLAEISRQGLTPKARQDFELSLSGYVTGRTEAMTVITRLKTLVEIELQYWNQIVEREKAIARLEALTGVQPVAREKEQ
ncbi:MAG TPA: TolC family protein [Dissulfurispiraceae bacterium]|nr:TolC family protein [Dissulfurispiraceae bacterium]